IMKQKRPVGMDESRQMVQNAVAQISIGHHSRYLEWSHLMDEAGGDVAAAKTFWKDSGTKTLGRNAEIKEKASFGGAIRYFNAALATLYEQAYRQRIRGDWTGLFCTWLNMGKLRSR
ncbi:hypothetical protein HDU91_003240, partial [Kappamyces sp. JEL0680]